MINTTEQGCFHATLLNDGQVLIVGGQTPADINKPWVPIPTVKKFSPVTGTHTTLQSMNYRPCRWYPGLTRLSDGRVLVMGGMHVPVTVYSRSSPSSSHGGCESRASPRGSRAIRRDP